MAENIKFTLKRTGSKNIVMSGDSVNQTLTLTNNSEFEISNIKIRDEIGDGATFVSNSVVIGGIAYAGNNIVNGFTLPHSITSGNSETITYTVKIDDDNQNKKMQIYSIVDFTLDGAEYTENSDTYTLEMADETIVLTKTSTKSAVIKGQTLTFQNVLENKGNLTHRQVKFQDDIPSGTTFVEGSVKVNGEARQNFNPQTGFTLSSLYAGETMKITFDVKVD